MNLMKIPGIIQLIEANFIFNLVLNSNLNPFNKRAEIKQTLIKNKFINGC